MTIKTFLKTASLLPEETSVLLRGDHGIGKSQVIRQLASIIATKEKIDDFEVIDRRLSQMSEGDMIGLPSVDGDVTKFNPPVWYRRACDKPCCLFLDELNRATHEIMQAAFQIVLDHELNGWKLHPQTRVYSAINSSGTYTVNEMDPALLDRFWCIDLRPDKSDWLEWARENVPELIIDFIEHDTTDQWLDIPKNVEPGAVTTSRRSWELLGNALKRAEIIDEPNNPLFYSVCLGYVGVEATIAFYEFAKSVDNRITGEDIIDHYVDGDDSRVRNKVKCMGQERQNGAIEKVAAHVTKNIEKLTDAQGENLKKFMSDLPGELRVSAWSKLTQHGIEKIELAKSVHKYCGAAILDVFGVPMGPAGVGVIPQIPSIFAKGKDFQNHKK